MEPQNVNAGNNMTDKLGNTVALDGNSQLFLALKDMSNDKFINKLNNATNDKPTKVRFSNQTYNFYNVEDIKVVQSENKAVIIILETVIN